MRSPFHLVIAAIGTALVLFGFGAFAADNGDYSGRVTGTVRYLNAKQGVVILTDGTELRTTGHQQLERLAEGTRAQFRFQQTGDRKLIMSVEPLP